MDPNVEIKVSRASTSEGVTMPPAPRTLLPLDSFVKALKSRGVLDVHQVGLPGCQVVLPYGCDLLERYAGSVSSVLKRYGFRQYDYPFIASEDVFAPAKQVLDLSGRLLVFGTDEGLERGTRLGGICPTGEATIYNHWRSAIRSAQDLPLMMFQRTRYVRPVAKGQQSAESIFKPMENADVFEFHAAVDSPEASRLLFDRLNNMNAELAAEFHLPVLASRRPLWTNRHEVSGLTHASDVILPNGKTLQVCCLYLQGDRFSGPFEVSFKRGTERLNTHHVTGAVSRRLLLSHLYVGMRPDGTLLIHPSLAPRQVQLVYCGTSSVEEESVFQLQRRLLDEGLRVDLVSMSDKSRLKTFVNESRAGGTPVTVVMQGKRNAEDVWKVIGVRSDLTSDQIVITPDIEPVVSGMVSEGILGVANAFDTRRNELERQFVRDAFSERDAVSYLAEGLIVRAPLREAQGVVEQVASWRTGEVLGFNDSQNPQRCIVTGELTATTAFIARRI